MLNNRSASVSPGPYCPYIIGRNGSDWIKVVGARAHRGVCAGNKVPSRYAKRRGGGRVRRCHAGDDCTRGRRRHTRAISILLNVCGGCVGACDYAALTTDHIKRLACGGTGHVASRQGQVGKAQPGVAAGVPGNCFGVRAWRRVQITTRQNPAPIERVRGRPVFEVGNIRNVGYGIIAPGIAGRVVAVGLERS